MLLTRRQKVQFISTVLSQILACAVILPIMTHYKLTNITKWDCMVGIFASILLQIIIAVWKNRKQSTLSKVKKLHEKT